MQKQTEYPLSSTEQQSTKFGNHTYKFWLFGTVILPLIFGVGNDT